MASPFKKIKYKPTPESSVLITGGSSGIGLEIAKLFVNAGAHVWILGRDKNRLATAVGLLNKNKVKPDQKVEIVQADVSNWDQSVKVIERITQAYKSPDVLINSAGIVKPGYFNNLEIDDFHKMIEVNYIGTVYYTKSCLPGMISRNSGYIVNISSFAGITGVFGYTAYSASKYAVRGFSDALRMELKPLNIGVSVVFPADTNTPQLEYENRYKPHETRYINSNGSIKEPEVIAEAIINGMMKGKYQIIPGTEPLLIYKAFNLIGEGKNLIFDWLVYKAQQQKNNS